ncbi:SDR family NAD(P)-dependent oxidoreductase [Embleya sp. NBC_00896]|uniref:SDR family NAD(P)-dependent oxidoreductase n=1 Tax=Embleya sp. NBC_00896 TaxID=2975961 RepID=UPI002F915F09|nr:SDR family NAD(P)-dependent oxidoreductase [Embleya sp. NBC_00896]
MPKTAIVTGGTGVLGLALVRGLCRRLGDDGVVYLTARDPDRGRQAVDLLRREGLAPRLEPFELGDAASARALADTVADRHGGVDILIAGAASRIELGVRNQDQVRAFVDANNHGTHRLIDAFAPLLDDGARFVLVTGVLGGLRHIPHRLRPRFDVEHATLDDLAAVMDDYVRAVEDGRAAAEGWPAWIDVPSMIGRVAAVKILARDLGAEAVRRDIVVNAACVPPTDRDADPTRAAADVLRLATLPPGSRTPYAQLVRNRTAIPFHA